MKLKLAYKGGPGSGHHGHGGLDDVWGGSTPGKGSSTSSTDKIKSSDLIKEILNDDKLSKLAAGLMADGGIDDVENVATIFEMYGLDISRANKNKLYKLYMEATSEPGYYIEYIDYSAEHITDLRKQWEKKYYGKVVNGFNEGDKYASEELEKFLLSKGCKKPETPEGYIKTWSGMLIKKGSKKYKDRVEELLYSVDLYSKVVEATPPSERTSNNKLYNFALGRILPNYHDLERYEVDNSKYKKYFDRTIYPHNKEWPFLPGDVDAMMKKKYNLVDKYDIPALV